ncbi:leucine rich repeat containing 9 [Perkinsus olseni]|uniref:Leucine rich repeat containing 9 n=1 Tax=Perkinsus olseni TaxID=32597 RepID=A0A7J6NUM3_PEROL|nr:leucine rich repeat containing 9 [Perkinsus olseni]
MTVERGCNEDIEKRSLKDILASNGFDGRSSEGTLSNVCSLELMFEAPLSMMLFVNHFPRLQKLWLIHTPLNALLDCEAHMHHLEELHLDHNGAVSLNGMARLCGSKLKKLHVNNNNVESLDFGGEMISLEELSAAGNVIATLTTLEEQCPALVRANLARNRITDKSLKELTSSLAPPSRQSKGCLQCLTELSIAANEEVREIGTILRLVSRLPSLTALDLADPDWGPPCPVANRANFAVAVVAEFPRLRVLNRSLLSEEFKVSSRAQAEHATMFYDMRRRKLVWERNQLAERVAEEMLRPLKRLIHRGIRSATHPHSAGDSVVANERSTIVSKMKRAEDLVDACWVHTLDTIDSSLKRSLERVHTEQVTFCNITCRPLDLHAGIPPPGITQFIRDTSPTPQELGDLIHDIYGEELNLHQYWTGSQVVIRSFLEVEDTYATERFNATCTRHLDELVRQSSARRDVTRSVVPTPTILRNTTPSNEDLEFVYLVDGKPTKCLLDATRPRLGDTLSADVGRLYVRMITEEWTKAHSWSSTLPLGSVVIGRRFIQREEVLSEAAIDDTLVLPVAEVEIALELTRGSRTHREENPAAQDNPVLADCRALSASLRREIESIGETSQGVADDQSTVKSTPCTPDVTGVLRLSGLNLDDITFLSSYSEEELSGLDVSYNNLESLDWLSTPITSGPKVHDIRFLDLSHNRLLAITQGQLARLNNLDTLNVSFNSLIDLEGLLGVLALDVGGTLRSLGLRGNLWSPRGVQRQARFFFRPPSYHRGSLQVKRYLPQLVLLDGDDVLADCGRDASPTRILAEDAVSMASMRDAGLALGGTFTSDMGYGLYSDDEGQGQGRAAIIVESEPDMVGAQLIRRLGKKLAQTPCGRIRILKLQSCGLGGHCEAFVGQFSEHLHSLEELSLARNYIAELDGLSKLLSACPIRLLDVSQNIIRGLQTSGFSEGPCGKGIQVLDVSFNRLDSLEVISKMITLRALYAAGNQLTELRSTLALRNLLHFAVLDVAGNPMMTDEHSEEFILFHLRCWMSERKETAEVTSAATSGLQILNGKIISPAMLRRARARFHGILTVEVLEERLLARPLLGWNIEVLKLEDLKLRNLGEQLLSESSFPNLKELHLNNNRLHHLGGLGFLPRLLVLTLNNNRLDLASEVLSGLRDAASVDPGRMKVYNRFLSLQELGFNKITDLSTLQATFPCGETLKILHLQGNELTEIEPNTSLCQYAELCELVLDHAKLRHVRSYAREITSLSTAIIEMRAKREMAAFRRTQGVLPRHLLEVTMKSPLLTPLRTINLAGPTGLSVNLREIHLEHNNLHDLAFVGDLPKLTGLFVASNRISQIMEVERLALNRLQKLRRLDLSANPVCRTPLYRLTVIQALPNLRALDRVVISFGERQKADSLAVTRVMNRLGSLMIDDEDSSLPTNASASTGLSVRTLGFDNSYNN